MSVDNEFWPVACKHTIPDTAQYTAYNNNLCSNLSVQYFMSVYNEYWPVACIHIRPYSTQPKETKQINAWL